MGDSQEQKPDAPSTDVSRRDFLTYGAAALAGASAVAAALSPLRHLT